MPFKLRLFSTMQREKHILYKPNYCNNCTFLKVLDDVGLRELLFLDFRQELIFN